MARYIDADKLDFRGSDFILDKDNVTWIPLQYANCVVRTSPTADVVEVKQGKWYRHTKKEHGDTCFHCSVCEKMALSDCLVWELTDYCPHCGAKMDGGKTE